MSDAFPIQNGVD